MVVWELGGTGGVEKPGGLKAYEGLYGEAPHERGTFFRLRLY